MLDKNKVAQSCCDDEEEIWVNYMKELRNGMYVFLSTQYQVDENDIIKSLEYTTKRVGRRIQYSFLNW